MPLVSRIVAIALVLVAAVALVQSRSLGWGAADAPDGTRYKVSPVTVSHVLQPDQPVSATEDCRLNERPGWLGFARPRRIAEEPGRCCGWCRRSSSWRPGPPSGPGRVLRR